MLILSLLLITWIGTADETDYFEIHYSNLFGDKYTFSESNMAFKQSDVVSKVSVCTLTTNCIKFDDTLLAVPPNNVFSDAEKAGLAIYRENTKSFELHVEYGTLSILNENLDGFVVQTFESIDGRITKSIGIYFYTRSKGIVSFEHKYKVLNGLSGEFEIKSEQLILSKSNGFFQKVRD